MTDDSTDTPTVDADGWITITVRVAPQEFEFYDQMLRFVGCERKEVAG